MVNSPLCLHACVCLCVRAGMYVCVQLLVHVHAVATICCNVYISLTMVVSVSFEDYNGLLSCAVCS